MLRSQSFPLILAGIAVAGLLFSAADAQAGRKRRGCRRPAPACCQPVAAPCNTCAPAAPAESSYETPPPATAPVPQASVSPSTPRS